jgi:diadenosine tetraphosphate (Ap4A) HIT family hydrolase
VDDLASLSAQESADLWALVNRMTEALRRPRRLAEKLGIPFFGGR